LVIRPEGRRNEILALIDHGLKDFSISRPVERTRGWGISVPDDPALTHQWRKAALSVP
jgi:methionyl-tRNA synthetase